MLNVWDKKIWCDRWIVKFGAKNFRTKHTLLREVLLLTKWSRQGNHASCIVLPKALWHMQAFCRDFSGTENHVLICDRPLYTAVAFVWKLFIQQQNASYAIFWSEQHLCWKIIYSPLFWEKTNQIIVLLSSSYIHQKVLVPLYVLYSVKHG